MTGWQPRGVAGRQMVAATAGGRKGYSQSVFAQYVEHRMPAGLLCCQAFISGCQGDRMPAAEGGRRRPGGRAGGAAHQT